MTDCSNAEIRDMLPDYLHEQLSAADAAVVEQHLSSCDDCTIELAILRSALDVRPHALALDVSRIVANLPKPNVVTSPPSVFVAADPKVRALNSAPSVIKKSAMSSSRMWRAAAALAVIAVGGVSFAIARHGMGAITPAGSLTDSAGVEVASNSAVPATDASDLDNSNAATSTAGDPRDVGLSVGELSDYSDAEIESVIQRLDQWDGAASADPLPGVPLLPASQGEER